MQLNNTPEEWSDIKKKFVELYHLVKSPDWTKEKQFAINAEIDSMVKFK